MNLATPTGICLALTESQLNAVQSWLLMDAGSLQLEDEVEPPPGEFETVPGQLYEAVVEIETGQGTG